ncbi:MAG: hypothetical protein QOK10_2095 [Pseudonocardiales bacterium]|nr:hypothetical protein [Pseudonocardiales bacterium]
MSGPESSAAAARSDRRREIAGVLVLVALGGGIVLLASSGTWVRLSAGRPAPFGPLVDHVRGRSEFPAIAGLAVVTLLAALLSAVTGRIARSALGVLVAIVAAASGWYSVRGLTAPGQARAAELLGGSAKTGTAPIAADVVLGWPLLAIAGSVLSLLGGAALVIRARRWNSGLSARYEPPAEALKSDDPWRSMDRGEDPTITDR